MSRGVAEKIGDRIDGEVAPAGGVRLRVLLDHIDGPFRNAVAEQCLALDVVADRQVRDGPAESETQLASDLVIGQWARAGSGWAARGGASGRRAAVC